MISGDAAARALMGATSKRLTKWSMTRSTKDALRANLYCAREGGGSASDSWDSMTLPPLRAAIACPGSIRLTTAWR